MPQGALGSRNRLQGYGYSHNPLRLAGDPSAVTVVDESDVPLMRGRDIPRDDWNGEERGVTTLTVPRHPCVRRPATNPDNI